MKMVNFSSIKLGKPSRWPIAHQGSLLDQLLERTTSIWEARGSILVEDSGFFVVRDKCTVHLYETQGEALVMAPSYVNRIQYLFNYAFKYIYFAYLITIWRNHVLGSLFIVHEGGCSLLQP